MENTIKFFTLFIFLAFIFGCTSKEGNKDNEDDQNKQVNPLEQVVRVENAQASDIDVNLDNCLGSSNCVKIVGNNSRKYNVCFQVHNPSSGQSILLRGYEVRIPASGQLMTNTCKDSTPLNITIPPNKKTDASMEYCMTLPYNFSTGEQIGFNLQLSVNGLPKDTLIILPVCF